MWRIAAQNQLNQTNYQTLMVKSHPISFVFFLFFIYCTLTLQTHCLKANYIHRHTQTHTHTNQIQEDVFIFVRGINIRTYQSHINIQGRFLSYEDDTVPKYMKDNKNHQT